MSYVETGQMSAVETGQMSAAETGQMSAVETRQMYSIKTGQRPVAKVDICLVSTSDICPVSTADISISIDHSASAFRINNQHIIMEAATAADLTQASEIAIRYITLSSAAKGYVSDLTVRPEQASPQRRFCSHLRPRRCAMRSWPCLALLFRGREV